MQIVNCKNCGKEIARVDATTLEVYEIRAGDERPIPRVDGKGNSVDRGKLLKQQIIKQGGIYERSENI
jgi:hypothetical protein